MTDRDANGRFIKGHSTGNRFIKGQPSANKGRRYKCKQYRLTEKGKVQKIKNLGKHIDKSGKGTISEQGYKILFKNGKLIREHHIVWSEHNQMPVPQECCIHHINQDKLDNRIENLMMLPHGTHTQLHNAIRRGDL